MSVNTTRPGGTSGYLTPTGVEVMSNKTVSSSTINTSTINSPTVNTPTIDVATLDGQASVPSTPAAGYYKTYVSDGDGKLHILDSAGSDLAVGSGSSGRNYLGDWFDAAKDIGTVTNSLTDIVDTSDRTANKTTWGSSNTSLLTIARSSSSPLRQSYSYLITEAGSSSGAFVESPLFTLDSLDLGKPVTVSFDVSGNSTSDYYQTYICRYDSNDVLKERIAIAGTASATSPYSARLPVGTTNFQGFFVAGSTSTDQYALRIVSNNNSADSLKIDSLYVGPQSVVQGAAVTDYALISDITTNFGGTGTLTCRGRQVGDCLELRILFASTSDRAGPTEAQITLPSRFTIDTDKLNTATGSSRYAGFIGVASMWDNSAGDLVEIYPVCSSSTISFRREDGLATVTLDSLDTSDNLQLTVMLPIVGWSSNVTMANRAVEEYASNSDTSNANDTSSFAYGASGSQFPNVSASNKYKRVRFQTPIQPTDKLDIEIYWRGVWQSIGNIGWGGTNSATLGMSIDDLLTGSTDIDVYFGSAGYPASAGDGGGAWSTIDADNNYKWRVRKVASGASVGYPISSANIVGRTDGVTVGSGYIGQVIEPTSAIVSTTPSTSEGDVTNASITLTPGVWLMQYSVGAYVTTGATSGNASTLWAVITDSANTHIGKTERAITAKTVAAVSNEVDAPLAASCVVNISASTTYKLRAKRVDSAGTGGGQIYVSAAAGYEATFYAIRIA